MKQLPITALLVLAPSFALAAPVVEISATPPLPVANLLANPGLEVGDARPEGWGVAASQPDIVDFRYDKQGGYHGAYLRVDARGSTSNGYLSQPVHVAPDTLYRAGVWVRLRGGTCVLWLHGYVEGRRYDERAYLKSYGALPLIPDFIDLAWTDSPDPQQWVWRGREFRTWPQQGSVNPHFGAYFDRGSLDLDEPFIGLARTALTVTVTGTAITRVVVADARAKVWWDSGPVAPGQPRLTRTLADLPTDTRYVVTARDADGTEVSTWYPATD